MRLGLAVAVAVLVPGCVRVNPSFGDGQGTGEGSGAGTGLAGTTSADSATSQPTASGSGVTGSATLPTTTTPPGPDVGASGPSTDTEVMPSDWWDTDYAHRRHLIFHQREEPLLQFVTHVPLSFSSSRLEGVKASQFAFVDALTDMRIPAEITVLNAEEGQFSAWVQLPLWRDDGPTEVFLYFGFTAPEVPSASPWSRHVGVWHMDSVTDAGSTPDATGSPDATQVDGVGEPILSGPGIVGGALQFDGESQRLEASLPGGLEDDSFLVSGWYANSYQADGSPIIARGDRFGDGWLDAEWVMGFTPVRAEGRVHDDQANGTPAANAGFVLPPAGGWHHYAFLYTGTNLRFYIDGSGTGASTIPGINHVLTDISIGGYTDPLAAGWESRLLDGRIDELRWRSGADDDAPNDVWVETLYESQLTPDATFTPAGVEDL